MIIPFSIFYYAYLIFVVIFGVYSLFNFYHLIRFGFLSSVNILVMILYAVLSALFIIFTLDQLAVFDWRQPLIDLSIFTQPISGKFF